MSIVKIIEVVGSSPTSWEDAVKNALDEAGKTVRGITRVGVKELDVRMEGDKIGAYRARIKISFRIER
jgi:flavin-binding protein dodecin